MPIYEISVTLPFANAERLSDALGEAERPPAIATGLFETARGDWRVFAHYDGAPDTDQLADHFERWGAGRPPEPRLVEAEDWVAASQRARPPVRAGAFLIHGSHDRERARGRRLAIEIDAGQAFGTAHHATTRGCLLVLHDHLKAQRPDSALDLGTGSGILGIALAKRLPIAVLASDSDPVAVAVAQGNAQLNGVGPRLRAITAIGLAHPALRGRRFDLVLANILAGPLYCLAPQLARALALRGTLILSGLLTGQARGLEARYRALGFALRRRVLLDDWAILLMQRVR